MRRPTAAARTTRRRAPPSAGSERHPRIETRLPVLFSEGVSKGRLSLERSVALTSTNPAKLYGLSPRKGTIVVGAEAGQLRHICGVGARVCDDPVCIPGRLSREAR
jgi:hypothetical protein